MGRIQIKLCTSDSGCGPLFNTVLLLKKDLSPGIYGLYFIRHLQHTLTKSDQGMNLNGCCTAKMGYHLATSKH